MGMLPLLTDVAILPAVSASAAIKLPIVVATATRMSVEELHQQIHHLAPQEGGCYAYLQNHCGRRSLACRIDRHDCRYFERF
jgi:hypothetical protein